MAPGRKKGHRKHPFPMSRKPPLHQWYRKGEWGPAYKGHEWAYRIAQEATKYPELVDPKLYEQAERYARIGRRIEADYGRGPLHAANKLLESRYKLSGWKKGVVLQSLLGRQYSRQTIQDLVREPAEHLPEAFSTPLGSEFVSRWNKEALANKFLSQARAGGDINLLTQQAQISGSLSEFNELIKLELEDVARHRKAGILGEEEIFKGREFIRKIEGGGIPPTSRPTASLGQRLLQRMESYAQKDPRKFAKIVTAGSVVGAGISFLSWYGVYSYFSGKDDNYNTLEGLPEGGQAQRLRHLLTDFGSGWLGLLGDERERYYRHGHTRVVGGRSIWIRGHFAKKGYFGRRNPANTIEALRDEGISGRERKNRTDFGSGYQGLPESLMGVPIDPRILEFRAKVWDDIEARKALLEEVEAAEQEAQARLGELEKDDLFENDLTTIQAINIKDKTLRAIRLDRFNLEVEDADTIVLRRKGFWPTLKSLFGYGDVYVRLAGFDAPEVQAHQRDPLAPYRIFQDQPHGTAGSWALKSLLAEADNLNLIVSEDRKTYGRYLGVLADETGQNINLEMVRRGAVSALPFGPASQDILLREEARVAEEEARLHRRGMWSYARYQATHQANEEIGRAITHNVLSRLDKTAANLNLGAYVSYLQGLGSARRELTIEEIQQTRRLGRSLRKTHGPPGRRFSGKDDAYNSIEGLGHTGVAWRKRRIMTDFGSGLMSTVFGGMKGLIATPRKTVMPRIMQHLRTQGITRFFEHGVGTVAIKTESGDLRAAIMLNRPKVEKIVAKRVPQATKAETGKMLPVLVGHEASEAHYLSRLIKMAKKTAPSKLETVEKYETLQLSRMVGSHTSMGVVADELILGAKLGPKYYKEIKKFRISDLESARSVLSSIDKLIQSKVSPKAFRQAIREQESISKAQGISVSRRQVIHGVSLTDVETLQRQKQSYQTYITKTEKLISSFEKKMLSKLSGETGRTIRGFQTENAVKGISEGAFAKKMRRELDIPFESAWIKRALKEGISAAKITKAAERLAPKSFPEISEAIGTLGASLEKAQFGRPHQLAGAMTSYRRATGITMSGERWTFGEHISSGGFGQALEATGATTGREAVFKRLGVSVEQETAVQALADPGFVTAPGWFKDISMKNLQKVSAYQQKVSQQVKKAITKLTGPINEKDIAGQMLQFEARAQQKAREELGSGLVGEIYGQNKLGIIQEMVGQSLVNPKMTRYMRMQLGEIKEIPSWLKPELSRMHSTPAHILTPDISRRLGEWSQAVNKARGAAIRVYEKKYANMLNRKTGFMHFDPGIGNVVFRGGRVKMIDFGISGFKSVEAQRFKKVWEILKEGQEKRAFTEELGIHLRKKKARLPRLLKEQIRQTQESFWIRSSELDRLHKSAQVSSSQNASRPARRSKSFAHANEQATQVLKNAGFKPKHTH